MEETRDLVFQMGVPLNILDDITAQYDGENRKQHFVQAWLDINRDASWEKLVAGLRKINMNSLADEIETEHISRVPVPSSASPSLLSTYLETPTPAPLVPLSTKAFGQRVAVANDIIEHLQENFFDLKSDARQSLSKRECQDPKFIEKFKEYLLTLPFAKKLLQIRYNFFRIQDEILKAKTIQKLFLIINRYCNYSNYKIIFNIVKEFCPDELKGRMERYRDSITSFEKATTVDVYLCAISARPGGEISQGFIRMTMKINKPPSECTLYEIRVLKESIEEEATLESYAMYIEAPGEG